MRVLVLNHNVVERGTYFRARETARMFLRDGHDVTFVTVGRQLYRARAARRGRLRVVHTAQRSFLRPPGEGWELAGTLQRLALAAGRFDLAYTFSHKPIDQIPARLARALGAFWLADWCDLWSSDGGILDRSQWPDPEPPEFRGHRGVATRAVLRAEERLEEAAATGADAVTIISSWMRGETRRLGVPDGRVHHFVTGADTRRIAMLDATAARRALGVDAARPVIGYVANVTFDNDQLTEALEVAWREVPDALFLTAGPRFWSDDSAVGRAQARGLVRDLGRVPFREVGGVLGAADVLVIPMRDTRLNWSRWPNKYGDYLAAGRPIVTTRIGDIPGDIEAHGLGEVAEPSGAALGAALARVLRTGPEDRAAMGARARRLAETSHGWDERFAGLRDFLRAQGLPVDLATRVGDRKQ